MHAILGQINLHAVNSQKISRFESWSSCLCSWLVMPSSNQLSQALALVPHVDCHAWGHTLQDGLAFIPSLACHQSPRSLCLYSWLVMPSSNQLSQALAVVPHVDCHAWGHTLQDGLAFVPSLAFSPVTQNFGDIVN
jgi:hypothetical protein